MNDLLNPISPGNLNKGEAGKKSKKTSTQKDDAKQSYIENKEGVFLPSRGLFYKQQYKDMDVLKVRPLNYTDEDILTTQSYYDNGTIFDELLKNTIIDENRFNSKQLVYIDRETILIWLRAKSLGKDFDVQMGCPNKPDGTNKCGNIETLSWDLSKIDIPTYTDEMYEELKENDGCRIITTPDAQLKVKITIPPVGTAMSLEKNYRTKKQLNKDTKDSYNTTTLLSIIEGVETDQGKFIYSKDEISNYLFKIQLPILDNRFILREFSKINLRYNTERTFTCKKCGHIEEGVEMPIMHKNFFWPELE